MFGYSVIRIAELVGRVRGKRLGTYFRDEIAKPLGADAHIGIGPEFNARVAEIIYAPEPKPGEATYLRKW
jgi:CubicO group peptidase (beta-lactamase class C family)